MGQAASTSVVDPRVASDGLAELVELLDDAEADRDALADALHDGLVQTLMVARYAADVAIRGGDVSAVREAVQEAVVELRKSIWHLRPRGAEGFVGALEQLSARVVESGGPALTLVRDFDTDLTGPAAVTAYRLVQAVAQVDGEPVRIGLMREADTVIVDVEGGAALSNLDRWERRAAALGGNLTGPAGRLRLALPRQGAPQTPAPRVPFGTDARTTS